MKFFLAALISVMLTVFQSQKDMYKRSGTLRGVFQDSLESKSSFGMRLRKVPATLDQIMAPVILRKSPANESTAVRLPDGTIKIFYINTPGKGNMMMSISSLNNGFSWKEPVKEFDLPGIAYHANSIVVDESGNLHCVFHIFGEGQNGYRGRQLNLWYCQTFNNGKNWSKPTEIFSGYVGSIRGFIELKNKRLLLVFAKAVPASVKKPEAKEIDYGWNEIISMYSDDKGITWKRSLNSIKIQVESSRKTRYGAIEPVVVQLKNGKIWMLIRTNNGYLYQSFSTDGGSTWQRAQPTNFISSDSPATLLRLSDGRLLIFWCSEQRWDDPDSYAAGGRHVLHSAVSNDEGKTWKGFREVLTSPSLTINIRGDHGTAYPSATETATGKVILVSGQGEAGSVVIFDPSWLGKNTACDQFSNCLVQWTLFGADTLTHLVTMPGSKNKALLLRKSADHKDMNTEAVWNFPMTKQGKLELQLVVNPGNEGICLALIDHFSISVDRKASVEAPLHFILQPNASGSKALPMKVAIYWNMYEKRALLFVNGKLKEEKSFHPTHFGFNYLRAGINGVQDDVAGYFIKSVSMKSKNYSLLKYCIR
ncbi:MAG TPA: sialidase family protein [Hanamia sp.]|nr:sialidase family protein [Hanamia sp.]